MAIEPYRPSNGTEGMAFQERWCERCRKDPGDEARGDDVEGCPILMNALVFGIDDPEYPKEWVYDTDDSPYAIGRCTAFEEGEWDSEPAYDPAYDGQMEMFDDG